MQWNCLSPLSSVHRSFLVSASVYSFPPAVGKIKMKEGRIFSCFSPDLIRRERLLLWNVVFQSGAFLVLRRSVPLRGERMSGLKLEDEACRVLIPSVTSCRGVLFTAAAAASGPPAVRCLTGGLGSLQVWVRDKPGPDAGCHPGPPPW